MAGSLLKGRCALITGSVGGLGFAMAKCLAAAGADIALNGLTEEQQVQPQCAALEKEFGIKAKYFRADLGKAGGAGGLVDDVAATFGSVDVLVNNAVVRYAGPVEGFGDDQWDHALAVNLSSAFHTIKHAMPHMRKRDWGRIVNISSVHGLFGTSGRIDYVATKTGLIGITKAIAQETRAANITCNAICPGSVLTPHSDGKVKQLMAKEGLSREAAERSFLSARGHSRFVAADSIGGFVVFLCGPAGRDISGAVVPIDAGYSSGHPADLGGGGVPS